LEAKWGSDVAAVNGEPGMGLLGLGSWGCTLQVKSHWSGLTLNLWEFREGLADVQFPMSAEGKNVS
jgi:hypothetical protein